MVSNQDNVQRNDVQKYPITRFVKRKSNVVLKKNKGAMKSNSNSRSRGNKKLKESQFSSRDNFRTTQTQASSSSEPSDNTNRLVPVVIIDNNTPKKEESNAEKLKLDKDSSSVNYENQISKPLITFSDIHETVNVPFLCLDKHDSKNEVAINSHEDSPVCLEDITGSLSSTYGNDSLGESNLEELPTSDKIKGENMGSRKKRKGFVIDSEDSDTGIPREENVTITRKTKLSSNILYSDSDTERQSDSGSKNVARQFSRIKRKRKVLSSSSEDDESSSPEDLLKPIIRSTEEMENLNELEQEVQDLDPIDEGFEEKVPRFRNPSKKAFYEKLHSLRNRSYSKLESLTSEKSDTLITKSELANESEEDDFIVDDEDTEVMMNARSLLPAEFSMTSHQGLKAHFRNFMMFIVQQAIDPIDASDISDHYLFSRRTIRKQLYSSVDSNIISSIWQSEFIKLIKTVPNMKSAKIDATYGCDACNIHTRMSTQIVYFKGMPYNEHNYKELDSFEPITKEAWMLGNSCFNRARIAHSIYHWEYKVSRHIQVELKFREASNTSEQGKNIVESIYEDLKDSNFFETTWVELCNLLKLASSSFESNFHSRSSM
ncbi:hypothetical protein POMI540_1678 [Schizosaccharomyces pombe]|uniref:Uncharacterized protein C17H9.06c n=1 Tax=Schizosaccharomyces pombe (strain 972 / ATCC 24843) TaxID=284812 RepID=YE06_SCHPO|nr:uncharacterized protein SPAC17H9.06c [Schizosaccharomyces pombe]O13803.1 RecName: Full=Uncharacterized protein C17H9.06c [Schizosaccharomyces pombe 972h-]CAB11215.1 conserved eukaryotic protein [Schizosaccharomyces pombe]|eukprot:NP_593576.1 uncharacterized protein SPAC17H9.06c [Schizosaccharomyces pombe]